MINPINALSAVNRSNEIQATANAAAQGANAAAGTGFGSVLSDVASDAIQTIKTGEATAIAGMQGQASVQQVAEAVMSAEQTLHTAMAVRDKIVSAYQELSRMAI